MYFHSMRYLDIYAAMDCLEWARNKSFSFIGLKGWLSLFLWLEMLCLAILGDETFLVGLVFVVLISFVFMLLANIRIYFKRSPVLMEKEIMAKAYGIPIALAIISYKIV